LGFSACCCLQDFERLLQDVNRTTYKEIKVYVDEVSLLSVDFPLDVVMMHTR
jgi:hypothetical protein